MLRQPNGFLSMTGGLGGADGDSCSWKGFCHSEHSEESLSGEFFFLVRCAFDRLMR